MRNRSLAQEHFYLKVNAKKTTLKHLKQIIKCLKYPPDSFMISSIKSFSRKLWTLPAYLKGCISRTCMKVLTLSILTFGLTFCWRWEQWGNSMCSHQVLRLRHRGIGVVDVSLGIQARVSPNGPHAFWTPSLILVLLHFLLVFHISCPLISCLSTHSLQGFFLHH